MRLTIVFFTSVCVAAAEEYFGNVAGRVVSAVSGKPVRGAAVAVMRDAENVLHSTSGTEGRFLISRIPVDWPSSQYSVVAKAPGYKAQVLRDVAVVPGAVMALECTFQLQPEGDPGLFKPFDVGPSFLYSHERSYRIARRSRVEAGQIFATREGLVGRTTANGHVIRRSDRFVALPSRRALNRRGDRTYRVRVTYAGRSVTVPVWDIGPWNIRDDYWSPASQRENWRSLPQGMPEAQAAYQRKFNGGRDGFGRRVLNPAGIDLSDAVFRDALQMRDNDWVRVEYLWDGRLISSRGPEPERRRPEVRRRRVQVIDLVAIAEAILVGRRR